MTSATQILKSGGANVIGSLALFQDGGPNQIDLNDGKTYLKSGIVGKSSSFPDVPSTLTKQLNPLVKIGDIGSGGSYKCIAIDNLGFALVVHQRENQGSYYRIKGASSALTSDVYREGTTNTALATGSAGVMFNRFKITDLGIGVVSREYSTIGSTGSLVRTVQAYQENAFSGNLDPGTTNATGCYAMNVSKYRWFAVGRNSASGFYSDTNNTATACTLPSASDWSATAANGTNWVTVAKNTTNAASSTDNAQTWTARTMPSASDWVDVAYGAGAGVFVAIAAGSANAATSPTGTTWTSRTLPVSQAWSAVCWSPALSLFVAVAKNSSTCATSPDGITWTSRSMPATANWEDVAWSPAIGKFVACASDGRAGVATSSDGITWVTKAMPRAICFLHTQAVGGVLYACEHGQNLNAFMNPIIAKSTDNGATWTYLGPRYNIPVGMISTNMETPLRLLNGKLVIASFTVNTPHLNVWSSSDGGSTWSLNTQNNLASNNAKASDICFGSGLYLLTIRQLYDGVSSYVGSTTYATSPDLVTWTWRTNLPQVSAWSGVQHNGTRFVLASSTDGANPIVSVSHSTTGTGSWTSLQNTVTINEVGGTVGGTTVNLSYDPARGSFAVSASNSNYLLYSLDGANWELKPNKWLQYAVQVGSKWAAVYFNQTYTADDLSGITNQYTFNHGVAFSTNQMTSMNYPGWYWLVLTTTIPYAAPIYSGGVNYFSNGQALYSIDSTQWVANDKAILEYGGVGTYYMRVK